MTAVMINRAPVMTLWAAVVAERLGFKRDEALTMGRVVAGLNAYSKAVSLGLVEPSERAIEKHRAKTKRGGSFHVDLLHRAVPVVQTPAGLRATSDDRPIDSDSVERYLRGKFGDALAEVRAAMTELARAVPPRQLAARAYRLYEEFRPEIPAGVKGWGAAGVLDLEKIRRLAERA